MKEKLLLIVIAFSILKVNGQTIVRYNLESQMNAFSILWDNDSLNLWGFRDVDDEDNPMAKIPAPTIYCNEGDSVVLTLTNPSFEAHTIHPHGLDVDQLNDGVPSTSFFVQPGQTGVYSFKATYAGNFLYHCHVGTVLHLQMGMYGAVVVKAANGVNEVYTGGPTFNREYLYLANEVDKSWHDDYTSIGAFTNYFPDYFHLNGKSRQQIWQDSSMAIYRALVGEKILLRLMNIGYGINRYIFPSSVNVEVVTSDGRVLPMPFQKDTLRLYPGERYGVLIEPLSLGNDSIKLDYLSMYLDKLWGTELIPLEVTGYLNLEENGSKGIKLIPNPATNSFRIESIIDGKLEMRDLLGRVVLKKDYSNRDIDISFLASGVYLVKLIQPSGYYNLGKIIKK